MENVYAIKQRRNVGKTGDVSNETNTSWMERLQELNAVYSSENNWKGVKKSRPRFMIAFLVNAAGEKVKKSVVVWKSEVPSYFRGLGEPSQQVNVRYFSNPKS